MSKMLHRPRLYRSVIGGKNSPARTVFYESIFVLYCSERHNLVLLCALQCSSGLLAGGYTVALMDLTS